MWCLFYFLSAYNRSTKEIVNNGYKIELASNPFSGDYFGQDTMCNGLTPVAYPCKACTILGILRYEISFE